MNENETKWTLGLSDNLDVEYTCTVIVDGCMVRLTGEDAIEMLQFFAEGGAL